ncbi:uncharacterized protein LOC102701650 [Oryza brachyantha]|uniref:uncharacterized protein LOC102701650 n=1 Tax=Oryza brachyantha TaxID=4533 RepID=UPI001AD9A7B9|nr:uncharacterized protein LOC102701650 [Oryza brachyantha]
MVAMACLGGWGDLPPDLLDVVADALPLEDYTRVRAVCTAWRAALPPTLPSLLVRRLDGGCHRFSTWCLSAATAVLQCPPTMLSPTRRCVGSGSGPGWIAVCGPEVVGLVNPLTGEEIPFRSFPQRGLVVSKIVFAPNPTARDFTAVVISDHACFTGRGRIAYTTRGNGGWAHVEVPGLPRRDGIADVVYHDKGGGKKVAYCLTGSGDVHVLHLPAGRHGQRRRRPLPPSFQRLFDKASMVFYPTVAFAPPYDDATRRTENAKNLVLCHDGHFYQIWRNKCNDEMLVLRYYPRRRPCWVAAKDLGGFSVFIGQNNAVALRVDGSGGAATPGLRRNCVYWIDGSRNEAKVFDMETGKSSPCFPNGDEAHAAICWCYMGTGVAKSPHHVHVQKRARRV